MDEILSMRAETSEASVKAQRLRMAAGASTASIKVDCVHDKSHTGLLQPTAFLAVGANDDDEYDDDGCRFVKGADGERAVCRYTGRLLTVQSARKLRAMMAASDAAHRRMDPQVPGGLAHYAGR